MARHQDDQTRNMTQVTVETEVTEVTQVTQETQETQVALTGSRRRASPR